MPFDKRKKGKAAAGEKRKFLFLSWLTKNGKINPTSQKNR